MKCRRGLHDLNWSSTQGQCLVKQKYFCTVYDYVGKADFTMGNWNPERNLGVAGQFLEIIKQRLF